MAHGKVWQSLNAFYSNTKLRSKKKTLDSWAQIWIHSFIHLRYSHDSRVCRQMRITQLCKSSPSYIFIYPSSSLFLSLSLFVWDVPISTSGTRRLILKHSILGNKYSVFVSASSPSSLSTPSLSLFLFLFDWRQHNYLIFISDSRRTHWKSVASLIFSFRCFFPEFDVLFENISNVSLCVCVFYYIFKWFDGFISRVRSVCSCNLSRLSLLNWTNLPPIELVKYDSLTVLIKILMKLRLQHIVVEH